MARPNSDRSDDRDPRFSRIIRCPGRVRPGPDCTLEEWANGAVKDGFEDIRSLDLDGRGSAPTIIYYPTGEEVVALEATRLAEGLPKATYLTSDHAITSSHGLCSRLGIAPVKEDLVRAFLVRHGGEPTLWGAMDEDDGGGPAEPEWVTVQEITRFVVGKESKRASVPSFVNFLELLYLEHVRFIKREARKPWPKRY